MSWKLIYGSINPPVFSRIPRTARRILDVGCGDGTLARAIRADWAPQVSGITHSAEEATRAKDAMERVWLADLDRFDVIDLGQFDCIVCSHVLEHLVNPWGLLRTIRPHLAPGGTLIVALPNLLFWRNRLAMCAGRFRYSDGGLMDRTHCKFFDWQTAAELVSQADFELVERSAHGAWPGSHLLGPLRAPLDRFAEDRFPGLFGWQFVVVGKVRSEVTPKPQLP
jgi:2-polyprenyl-3-methyl-5-hydroxy-6-metoxy-1,4-benzoquinol methylase